MWREPVLFGVSWLDAVDSPEKIGRYVGELAGRDPQTTASLHLQMAGEMLAEFGHREQFRGHRDVWEEIEQTLLARMLASEDTVQDRIRFGLSLGLMGDPRPETSIDPETRLPNIAWSEELVPPEEGFLMGSSEADDDAYPDEGPQFRCKGITTPFFMARHPITVSQYLAFVKAGGYGDDAEPWWTEAGWEWKSKEKITGPAFVELGVGHEAGNHPATGISFYEAVAFCRWLREAGADDDRLRCVRLPNEMEWEFAARGVTGRRYPWGDENENLVERCHFSETGVDHPSAVGLFGETGRAVDSGVNDLSGNVLEWTCSEWESNYKKYQGKWDEDGDATRALRGGSFLIDSSFVRAAVRFRFVPVSRYSSFGFRLVSSPSEGPET